MKRLLDSDPEIIFGSEHPIDYLMSHHHYRSRKELKDATEKFGKKFPKTLDEMHRNLSNVREGR